MMMRTDGFNAGVVNIGATSVMAAELPYGNGAYSMLLLMPQSGSVDALVQQLDTARMGSAVRSLGPSDGAQIGVPRFTLSTSRDLSADLIALGMPRAFGNDAEFPRLIVNETEQIGFVQHAVTLEVNERGTRAAAVTAVGIIRVSMPPSYIFDKPFVFAIRERLSGTILFIGVVRDPRA
jgi:serpin B